ncbi:MAG: hypothetical protein AAF752_11855 [Bacteroidota bacterium]
MSTTVRRSFRSCLNAQFLKIADHTPRALLVCVVLVGAVLSSNAQAPLDPLPAIRELYLKSAEEETLVEEGIERTAALIEQSNPTDPTLEAYHAGFLIMRAKHTFWPKKKLRYLREGLPILDEIVKVNREHIEARYLRLLSCYYLPNFLGRKWSVREDFKILGELLPKHAGDYPPRLYADMVSFLLKEGSPGPELRSRLKQTLGTVLPATR